MHVQHVVSAQLPDAYFVIMGAPMPHAALQVVWQQVVWRVKCRLCQALGKPLSAVITPQEGVPTWPAVISSHSWGLLKTYAVRTPASGSGLAKCAQI